MDGKSECRRKSRGRFLSWKLYAESRPTPWMLQELDVRNLTSNVTKNQKRPKGGSGGRSILSDRVGRSSILPVKGANAEQQTAKTLVSVM